MSFYLRHRALREVYVRACLFESDHFSPATQPLPEKLLEEKLWHAPPSFVNWFAFFGRRKR